MLKKQFLDELTKGLEGLPENEIKERVSFYNDMIDDRIEDGMSEEDAVGDIGSVEEVKSEILSDVSLVKIVKHKMKPKRKLETWEIVLLAVTSPIWVSLLIAAIAVVIALFAALWAVVVALFAGDFALGFGGVVGGVGMMVQQWAEGFIGNGVGMFGIGLVSLGLSFLLVTACIGLTKALVKLIKFTVLKIKHGLVGGK